MENINKQRVEYIDIAKFIGIFLLFVEHTGNWIELTGGGYGFLKSVICSFHMPLFFIIYGIVVKNKHLKGNGEWSDFFTKQLRALIVPYILWALIYSSNLGIKFFLGVMYGSNPALSYAGTNAVLWFLPVMFICTVLYQLVLNIIENNKIVTGGVLLLFLLIAKVGSYINGINGMRLPWGIDIVFVGTVFMVLGNLVVKKVLNYLLNSCNRKTLIGIMTMILICGALGGILNVSYKKYKVTVMAVGEYGKSIIMFVMVSIALSVSVLILSSLFRGKLLVYLGRHSLVMMAVHYILFPCTVCLVKKILLFQSTLTIAVAVINALLVTAICIPICYLVDEFCPCLNGK